MAPTARPLPDLSGRTALVTGASSGVGLEIAHALAATGATLVLPVRNREKGTRAAQAIGTRTPAAHVTLVDLDLANLSSVASLVTHLTETGTRIDLLILNAGIIQLGEPDRQVTVDGHELHLQTNFLGHAALTLGLLPLLRGGRVVPQLSLAARAGRLLADDPQVLRRYHPFRAYASSKIALGTFGVELARRSAADDLGITVHLCHPGVAPDTGIAAPLRDRKEDGRTAALVRRISNTPALAALPALAAATVPAAASGAALPSFHVPRGPGQLAGPARSARVYRSLRSIEHGSLVWRWARDPSSVALVGAGVG